MVYKEAIIGFDCREMWLPNVESWTEEKRDKFLLRQGIERCLSVSQGDWNSIFLPDPIERWYQTGLTAPDCRLRIPDEYQAITLNNFWSDVEALRKFLQEHEDEYPKPCWTIAMTVVDNPGEGEYYGATFDIPWNVRFAELNPDWIFIGYDVQDEQLGEGLGGGYSEERMQELRERFGKRLNQYHLFDEQEQAVDYCNWQAWAENRPRFVYGLYLIEKQPKDDAST